MGATGMTVEEVIRQELGDVCAGTKLSDVLKDSLEFIDLLQTIEREAGVKIPDAKVAQLETIGDLLDACHVSA